jgi:uncharacterized coiled-coil protein SlyX
MSDDLITYVIGQLRGACWEEEAAAVEALVDRIEQLEAKLAKAVDAIKEIKAAVALSKVPIAWLIRHQCKVALAELEGGE